MDEPTDTVWLSIRPPAAHWPLGGTTGGYRVPDVLTGRILERPQIELRQGGIDVIENVGLDVFVIRPYLVGAEDIHFQRQTLFGRLELPHQEGHVLTNLRMRPEVGY